MLLLGAGLFFIGLAIFLTKKHPVIILMGIELMLNATNINLVAFSQQDERLQGQIFALFVMIVTVAESAVALAIMVKIFYQKNLTEKY